MTALSPSPTRADGASCCCAKTGWHPSLLAAVPGNGRTNARAAPQTLGCGQPGRPPSLRCRCRVCRDVVSCTVGIAHGLFRPSLQLSPPPLAASFRRQALQAAAQTPLAPFSVCSAHPCRSPHHAAALSEALARQRRKGPPSLRPSQTRNTAPSPRAKNNSLVSSGGSGGR